MLNGIIVNINSNRFKVLANDKSTYAPLGENFVMIKLFP